MMMHTTIQLLLLLSSSFVIIYSFTSTHLSTITVRRSNANAYSTILQSSSRPYSSSPKITNNNNINPSRARLGRPPRKISTEEEFTSTGRVAVYCVGAELDLQALRTHVFRRGFGNNQNSMEILASTNTDRGGDSRHTNDEFVTKKNPELVLARASTGSSSGSADPLYDDDVLHVSNAPLFITYNSQTHPNINSNDSKGNSKNSINAIDEEDSNAWKTKELLLMATQDIFYFDYGCVVFWGLTASEEKAAIDELSQFTIDAVSPVELDNSYDVMEFVLDRKANPQRPVKFDRMRLRTLQVEEKLALSYAMAQSSKLFVFERKVFESVEMTRYLPKELATKGKIERSKKELNQLIGQLFVQQTEVNLFSSILDTPDFLWDDDEHLPVYHYTRSYLEVDDRVALLNSRLSVIRELLDVIEAQVADSNSARLEWIIIWLISVEIVLGLVSNPLFAGKRAIATLLLPAAVSYYAYSSNKKD